LIEVFLQGIAVDVSLRVIIDEGLKGVDPLGIWRPKVCSSTRRTALVFFSLFLSLLIIVFPLFTE